MIEQFTKLADLLELRGDSAEAAALRRASAGAVSGLDARTRWRADAIRAGRGPDLVADAERELPRDFVRLLQTGLLSTSELVLLHRRLDLLTTGDLALALEGHVVAHRGVPEDLAERARRALETADPGGRLTLGRALDAVDPLVQELRAVPDVSDVSLAGSLRRVEPTVRDLRIVAATAHPEAVRRALDALPQTGSVRFHGAAGLTVMSGPHEVSIKLAAPEHFGTALLFHTGSREHLALLQKRARRAGLTLTGQGFTCASGDASAPTEVDAYARVGLPWIAPELRQGTDEVDDASRRALPPLLEGRHIRGDLHMHTQQSDGRDPLEAMVSACAALGYEYMAVTDHSESAAASRTVTPDDLLEQIDEIARLQEQYPSMRILSGIEVEILPDGRLDFPDSLLERLDIVLASLHERAGHSPARLLKRYRRAAEHPLVTMLTHPANRLVGRFDGYDLDFDALFDIAVRTGTWLEVDGAPSHLDLDGSLARRAVEAGVDLAVDSDCHHARLLGRQMQLAVGTARRGRVQARHVVNTRGLSDLLPWLLRKRRALRP